MESVTKARARMLKFPKLIAECKTEGATYAACISAKQDNLKKDCCQQEFEQLKRCVMKAAAKMGTRV